MRFCCNKKRNEHGKEEVWTHSQSLPKNDNTKKTILFLFKNIEKINHELKYNDNIIN